MIGFRLRLVLYLFLVFFPAMAANKAFAQIIEGTLGYVTYEQGDLPIVISVPHGGYLLPDNIPDRICQNPVYAQDAYTLELGQRIDSSFFEITGCRPHMVYCQLHRRKLDANRNLSAGACGNPDAVTAWQEFHGFIEEAQAAAVAEHDEAVFFMDLHGHGNPIQRIELGYLLYDDELELSDAQLNTPTFINYSSIQNLVGTNSSSSSHAALLRGPQALGSLLGNKGYPSVPSEAIPSPGTNSNYFSGGYITFNHTSYANGNDVNGVQVECNFTGIRDTYAHRRAFADSLVYVMAEFMGLHFDSPGLTCTALNANTESITAQELLLFPNPASNEVRIEVGVLTEASLPDLTLYDLYGKLILRHVGNTLDVSKLTAGMYLLSANVSGKNYSAKLMVH